jgi:hypothetical protein
MPRGQTITELELASAGWIETSLPYVGQKNCQDFEKKVKRVCKIHRQQNFGKQPSKKLRVNLGINKT